MRTGFGAKISSDPFAERHWLAAVWSDELAGFIDNVLALQVPRAWVVFHEKLTRANGSMSEIGRYENLREDLFRLTRCCIGMRLRNSHAKGKSKITRSRLNAIEKLERETIKKFYRD